MSQTPQPFKLKRWLYGTLGAAVATVVVVSLYREAAKLAAGFVILTICGVIAFLVISSFWSAVQYSRERPRGKPHSLTSQLSMFVLATVFSAFVLCISTPLLIPLWRLYVTPIVDAIFTLSNPGGNT